MNDSEYYIASGWMKNQLGLEGDEMVVYAIIYGYSQDGISKFQGTAQRIADWIGKEKRTVYKILKSLCEKGLIERHEKRVNDVPVIDYSVAIDRVPGSAKNVLPPCEKRTTPSAKNAPPVQKSYGGSAKNVLPPCKNLTGVVQKMQGGSAKILHLKDSIYTNKDSIKTYKDNTGLPEYFIRLWQSEPDIVNCLARLKSPNDWAEYWRLYQGTKEDIKRSWNNFIDGVKTGVVDRKFVPANPDTFILSDGLNRYRDPPKKRDGPKIGKDAVNDVSQFFKRGSNADA
jgi:hypothetical protein